MLPIKCINYTLVLRCINKDTFDYFDVKIPRGLGEDFRENILKYINEWSGGGNLLTDDGLLPKAHYYALIGDDPNYAPCFVSYPKSRAPYAKDITGKLIKDGNGKKMKVYGYVISIDLNTNKIREDIIPESVLKILGVDSIYDHFK